MTDAKVEMQINRIDGLVKLMKTWCAFKAVCEMIHSTSVEEKWSAEKEQNAIEMAAVFMNWYINSNMRFIQEMTTFLPPRGSVRLMLMIVQEIMYSAIMTGRQIEGESRAVEEIDKELFDISEEGTKYILAALNEAITKREFHQRIKPMENTAPTVVGTRTKQ